MLEPVLCASPLSIALLAIALPAASPSHRQPLAPEDGGPPLAVTPIGEPEEHVGSDRGDPATGRARLRGQILQLGSRDHVAGARVIQADGEVVETDGEGRFELWLAPGDHVLLLRAPGYDDLSVRVELADDEDASFEFRMGRDARAGGRYHTTVRQEREVAVSSTRLTGDELYATPGSFGDPFRVVQSLPGASQLAGFLPYVVVRGAAPGNTGYYLDGVRVPLLFHVAVGPAVVHPYFIDSVDFYPSGAPVRLGRYASGMIEGRTRPARRDRVRGEFDIRLTDAGGLVEIPLNRKKPPGCRRRARAGEEEADAERCRGGPARGSLTLAGRYGYTGALLTLLQSTARISFWDYQARFDHRLGGRANYTAFVYGSFDEVGEKGAEDPFLRFTFHRIQQRVRQDILNGRLDYSLALGFESTGASDSGSDEWRIAPRVDLRRRVGRGGDTQIGLGLDQEFQIFRARLPGSGGAESTESFSSVLGDRFVSATGAYAELIWRKGKVEIRPGARADLYVQDGPSAVLPGARSVSHAVGVDPRVLFREQLSERWALRQNIGLYHQPPSFPVPLPGVESFGFDLGLQRNLQGSTGYEFKIGDTLRLSQDVFLGWLTNLFDYELATALEGNVSEVEDFVIQTTGFAYGLETMLRLDPRMRVYGWAAYTLSRSVRNYTTGGTAPSNWDQTHILNIVLGYKLGKKWNLGGRLHLNSGRPYTAVLENQNVEDALASSRNQQRLPGFFQLDLRVERNWNFRSWYLQLVIDVINATYSREVLACVQPDDTNASLGVMTSDSGVTTLYNPPNCDAQSLRYVLPSVGVRGVF